MKKLTQAQAKKAKAAYAQFVAAQVTPRRFKPWDKLPLAIQAFYAGVKPKAKEKKDAKS